MTDYLSFDQKPEEFMEWIDNSIKHNLIAFENGDSEDCKDCALWDIICAYRYSNRMTIISCRKGSVKENTG